MTPRPCPSAASPPRDLRPTRGRRAGFVASFRRHVRLGRSDRPQAEKGVLKKKVSCVFAWFAIQLDQKVAFKSKALRTTPSEKRLHRTRPIGSELPCVCSATWVVKHIRVRNVSKCSVSLESRPRACALAALPPRCVRCRGWWPLGSRTHNLPEAPRAGASCACARCRSVVSACGLYMCLAVSASSPPRRKETSPALCLSSPSTPSPLLPASRLCMRSCETNAGCTPLPPAASHRGPRLPAQRRLQVHWDRARTGRKKCETSFMPDLPQMYISDRCSGGTALLRTTAIVLWRKTTTTTATASTTISVIINH